MVWVPLWGANLFQAGREANVLMTSLRAREGQLGTRAGGRLAAVAGSARRRRDADACLSPKPRPTRAV